MAQDPLKTSTRAILALVQAKKLRKAAHELRKIEPYRKKIYGYDRLIAAVHSPLNNAEKLFYEAQAVVPDVIHNTEGDAKTRGNRTRHAIRRLMKARAIVRDDPEINALLKRCLAAIQEAENKLSAAQNLALRGNWHGAYHEIKQAAQMDDSPEVRETQKFITQYYARQTRDEQKLRAVKNTGIFGAIILLFVIFGVGMYTCSLHEDADAYRQKKLLESGRITPANPASPAPAQSAPAELPDVPLVQAATPAAATPVPAAIPEQPAAQPAGKPAEKALEINSESEFGTSLGHLPPGTKITLRYKSGAWRAWNRATGFSPDAPAEGGQVHSLSIRGMKPDKTIKTLGVVPYDTKTTPFTYEVLGKYDAILLRINEDPGQLNNNDGVVTYGVLVTPPQ